MMSLTTGRRARWQSVSLAALAAASFAVLAGAAQAGECPADKRGVDVTKPSTAAAKDVTDKVLGSIDLAKEKIGLADHQMRLRKLEIKPGGIVPWHSHGDRPAMIYIVSGEVVEYASSCAVPIVHKTGDIAPEKNGTSHWWQNTGKSPAVLISVDLFPAEMKMDQHMM